MKDSQKLYFDSLLVLNVKTQNASELALGSIPPYIPTIIPPSTSLFSILKLYPPPPLSLPHHICV